MATNYSLDPMELFKRGLSTPPVYTPPPTAYLDPMEQFRRGQINSTALPNLQKIVNGQQTSDIYGNADVSTLLKNAVTSGASDAYIQGLAAQRDTKIAGSPNYTGVQSTTDLLKSFGYNPQANTLQQTFQQPIQQQMPAYSPTNNMGTINSQNDAALQATLASIRAAVQQATGKQTVIQQQAPEQYQKLKNTVFNQSLSGLPSMNENVANLGASSTGGYSRTEQGKVESDLKNNLGNLDMQKQQVIDTANSTIADLESQGLFDEAKATADTANTKLQQILAESARLDTMGYQISRDTVTDATNASNTAYSKLQDTIQNNAQYGGTYNDNKTIAAQQNDTANAQWDKTYALDKSAADLNAKLTNLNIDTANINLKALPQQIKDQATLVTQQIASGKVNIDVGKAQLKELTDPNSTTNKLAKLGLDTAKFNYDQLDVTAKQLVSKIADDLANSKMSRESAQASINHAGDSAADSAAANAADLARKKDPLNPANTKVNTNTTATVDDYANTINSMYVQKYDSTNGTAASMDTKGIKTYLDNLIISGVSPDIIDSLAARYGIK